MKCGTSQNNEKGELKKMGGIRSGIRRVSQGANLPHPKLTPWGVVGIMASVVALLGGYALGKYLYGKTKGVVGNVIPSASGKDAARDMLGI